MYASKLPEDCKAESRTVLASRVKTVVYGWKMLWRCEGEVVWYGGGAVSGSAETLLVQLRKHQSRE